MAAGTPLGPPANPDPPTEQVSLSSSLRACAVAFVVAVASYGAANLGHAMVLSSQGVSVLWPACAYLVSVLVLVPRRTWPLLIPAGLAGFAVHDYQFGFTPGRIALLNIADTIEILIIVFGLRYSFDGLPRLNGSKAFAKYCFYAVFLGPFVSAFVVPLAVPGAYLANWRIWFFSQTLAFLTLPPAILSWAAFYDESRLRAPLRARLEAVALIGGLALLGYFVVLGPWNTMPTAFLYSFVPFLLWAALRFGSMGVSTAMIVISFWSIWGAIYGHGPFAAPESIDSVLSLQLFLMFASIPFMTLAVMAEERARHVKALSSVSRRLIEAHEEERQRIARELHDDFNQRIALVSIDLHGLESSLAGSEAQARSASNISRQIHELSSDIHALSHRLHSSKLQHLGLVAGCHGFCKELSARRNVEIGFQSDNVPANLSAEISLCLFRVLQEALQNAVKHSGARAYRVSLGSRGGEVQLTVRDSGAGFDPARAMNGRGLGLTSMQERMMLVGGRLSIDSRPGHGTTVSASVVPR